MLLKPLTLAAAGLAAVTEAFLIPPEITEADKQAIEPLTVETFNIAESHVVNVDCPGCFPSLAFAHHDKMKEHKEHKHHPSHLELNFFIDQKPEGDRLLLNGFELYPTSDPFSQILTAPVVPDKPKHKMKHKKLESHHKKRPHNRPMPISQELGFGLQVSPVARGEDDMMELISIDFQIVEVGSTFVDGIPNVHINLIKTPDAKLMVQSIETTESQSPGNPMDKQEECTTMLCRWRAIISDHVNGMRPHQHCGGKMGAKGGQRPHHHGVGPHREGGDARYRSWGHLFAKFYYHILAPVLVGVFAGIGVSLMFMGIWALSVGLYRKVVRGQSFFPERRHFHCRRHLRRKAAAKEAAVDEEKSGLMEHHDLPPSYDEEAAPKAEL